MNRKREQAGDVAGMKTSAPAIGVIFVSTELSTGSGGVGFVVTRLMSLMEKRGINVTHINSHVRGTSIRKVTYGVLCFLRLPLEILKVKARSQKPIVYVHVGSGVSTIRKTVLMAVSRLVGARTVAHLHAGKGEAHLGGTFWKYVLYMLGLIANSVFVLSPVWALKYKEVIDEKKIVVVRYPLSTGTEERYREMGLGPNQAYEDDGILFQVATICRLEEGKGVECVIDAMNELDKKWTLKIGGNGTYEEHLKRKAIESGLNERVEFLGWLDEEAKGQLLSAATVFILPSVYESFGVVYIEALSYRVPVVAANREVVKEGLPKTGTKFVDPRRPKEISRAALELAGERPNWQKIGKFMLSRYRSDVVLEEYIAAFSKM